MTIPCMVCFTETSEISIRSWCCSGIICLSCLEAHVSSKIEEAVVKIVCPLGNCDSLISEDEIKELVSDEVLKSTNASKWKLNRIHISRHALAVRESITIPTWRTPNRKES